MDIGVVQELVVARDSSEECDFGARGSEEAIAVGCSHDAKERSADNLYSATCSLDVSDAATFVEDVRLANWLSRAPLLRMSYHAQLGPQC